MEAKITAPRGKETAKTIYHIGKVQKNRKEPHFYKELCALTLNAKRKPCQTVIARYYSRNGNKVFCCVWAYGVKSRITLAGGGCAAGGGYHKESAALAAALSDAGVELSENINGAGDRAVRRALEALAHTITRRKKVYIHEASA